MALVKFRMQDCPGYNNLKNKKEKKTLESFEVLEIMANSLKLQPKDSRRSLDVPLQ